MEAGLSKYAAKQQAKAKGTWVAPASMSVSVAVEIPAPMREDEEDFADLGKLPELCAAALQNAVAELKKAANVAAEMERLSHGVQAQEPRGIRGACASAAVKFKKLAKRAARIS